MMQKLLIYQAIWALENTPGIDLENDIDGALDLVFASGFDGVGASLGRHGVVDAIARGVHERGGTWEASAFIRTPDELLRSLERAQNLGAHHLNVQILERKDRVSDAVGLLEAYRKITCDAVIPIRYETHRGRLTNDLYFTLRILKEMPDLRLTGDLSHYPLVNEFPIPVPVSDLERISTILTRCDGYHGRVCGSHQVQVSILAPQHQPWAEQFFSWWAEGFQIWKSLNGPDAELTFMTELGPPHYAITDAHGNEISDRWAEALLIKDRVREIWRSI